MVGSHSISQDTFTLDDNNSIALSANNNPGWEFKNWTGDTEFLLSPNNNLTYISWYSPDDLKNLHFEANFSLIEFQINCGIEGNGTFHYWQGDLEPQYDLTSHSSTATTFEEVAIIAEAKTGWYFSHWNNLPQENQYDVLYNSFLDANANLISFLPLADVNLTAVFSLIEYNETEVIISDSPNGFGTINSESNGNFLHFGQYELNATASPGYTFLRWEGEGNETNLLNGPNEPINKLSVEGPISLQPIFGIREYGILVEKEGNGTISGSGNYNFDDNGSTLISADPDDGWYFDKWADDGNISYLSSSTPASPVFFFTNHRPSQSKPHIYCCISATTTSYRYQYLRWSRNSIYKLWK